MTTRQRKIDEDNGSDVNQDIDEGDEINEDSQDEGDGEETEEKPITKRRIGAGSGMVHLLPIQFNVESTTKANVDAYFELFIKENEYKAKDENYCQYTSILRGHPLNGKKHTDVTGLTYYQLISKQSNVFKVNQAKSINEYIIWQYDDPYFGRNPLNNIKQTMTKLDILS